MSAENPESMRPTNDTYKGIVREANIIIEQSALNIIVKENQKLARRRDLNLIFRARKFLKEI